MTGTPSHPNSHHQTGGIMGTPKPPSPSPPPEHSPLPPELRPILGEPLPAGVPLDPVVSLFLRREQREQRRERESSLAQRLRRFLQRKFFIFRRRSVPKPLCPLVPRCPRAPVAHRCPRSALMTLIALRNLVLGRPSPERLAQEVTFANWRGEETWPETSGGAQRGPEL